MMSKTASLLLCTVIRLDTVINTARTDQSYIINSKAT